VFDLERFPDPPARIAVNSRGSRIQRDFNCLALERHPGVGLGTTLAIQPGVEPSHATDEGSTVPASGPLRAL